MITADSPAQAGEYISLLASNLGDFAPVHGDEIPAETINQPSIIIDDGANEIFPIKIDPTQEWLGVYRLTIEVPDEISNGAHIITTIKSQDKISNSATIYFGSSKKPILCCIYYLLL